MDKTNRRLWRKSKSHDKAKVTIAGGNQSSEGITTPKDSGRQSQTGVTEGTEEKKEKKTSEERIKAMRTKHTKFAESEEKAFWQWV